MAPKKGTRAARKASPPAIGGSSDDGGKVGLSQPSLDTQQIDDVLAQINRRNKERRRKRQEAIIKEHKARVQQTREDLKKCFKEYDEKVRSIRQSKVSRLLELVQQRRRILAEMDKCKASIQSSCLTTAKSVEAGLIGRISDLSGS